MPPLKNQRRELFAQGVFSGLSHTDAAIAAGYKPAWAATNTTRLLTNNDEIIQRIDELNAKAESGLIMSKQEKEEKLSEIARGNLTDFVQVGKDGESIDISLESGHPAALSEVTISTFAGGKDQRARSKATKVKLHDPVQSIKELNKMAGHYPPVNTLKLEPGEGLTPILTELLAKLRGYNGNQEDKED